MKKSDASRPRFREHLIPWAGALTLLGLAASMILAGPLIDIALLVSLFGFGLFLWGGLDRKERS